MPRPVVSFQAICDERTNAEVSNPNVCSLNDLNSSFLSAIKYTFLAAILTLALWQALLVILKDNMRPNTVSGKSRWETFPHTSEISNMCTKEDLKEWLRK